MKSLIFLSLLAILPTQAFCDKYWVCCQETIQKELNKIQGEGGTVIDIQTFVVNEMTVSYTIRYKY